MKKEITHFDVFSVANIAGILHFGLGILIGFLYFMLSLSMPADAFDTLPWMKYMFGVGALVVMPVFYGVLGWVFSALSCLLYNAIAARIGGFKVEIAD